jgi:hypothetical protein
MAAAVIHGLKYGGLKMGGMGGSSYSVSPGFVYHQHAVSVHRLAGSNNPKYIKIIILFTVC